MNIYRLKRTIIMLFGGKPIDVSIWNGRLSSRAKGIPIEVGVYSSINRGFRAITTAGTRIDIGKFCSIGPGCTLVTGNHPTSRPSSSVVLWLWLFGDLRGALIHSLEEGDNIRIGNDVWVGKSVTIFPGVSIGDGAIIGAGAVVAGDVEDYSICAGNPVRHIRYRFEQPVRDYPSVLE